MLNNHVFIQELNYIADTIEPVMRHNFDME